MTTSFSPVVPYHLIQGVRLVQALAESRFTVCIPNEHAPNFSLLRDTFGMRYRIGTADVLSLAAFELSHAHPATTVGSLKRSLVFPHAILRHCRALWPEHRSLEISFAGLVTSKRRALLEGWARRHAFSRALSLPELEPWWHTLSNRAREATGAAPRSRLVKAGRLHLWSSTRGRAFPVKAWDAEYFRLLAASQFVLCPSGDYTWSYRFFEAALCGAIPVVEESCDAYDGFSFRRMDERLEDMAWSPQVAEHNYEECVRRISIPSAELNDELERLLEA